ncbi:MAG: TonB-dependent receptor [Gemmatimonadetes bacterium]|nr:TonB-dependent receptor [Gemmatimonadota bacterium]
MFFRYLLVASAVVVGATAEAQTSVDSLAPATITALRLTTPLAAPLGSATVISGESLRMLGVTRLPDALRAVAGVHLVGSGSTGSQTSLFLRGGNSNYVRVLVDGVPVNDAGGFVDLATIPASNIERIEIVRGPASVLYGSDAVSGVVQIFTRGLGARDGWRSAMTRGTRGSSSRAMGYTTTRERWSASLDGALDRTKGVLPFNNRFRSDALSGSLALVPDTRTDLRFAARWTASQYQYPTDYDGTVADSNAEQSDHRFTASVDMGRRVSNRVELRGALQSNEYYPRTNDGADFPADTFGFYGFYSRATRTLRRGELRANVALAPRRTLSLGADVTRERERSTSRSLSEYGDSDGAFEAARHTTGLYAQLAGDATPRLSFALGARRDMSSAFDAFGTTRASLGWIAGRHTRLRASAGNAFKAPSFFENFATGFVTGNPGLKPERAQSVEVTLDQATAGGRLALVATAFGQQFRDIIQYSSTAPSPGAPNYFNVAGARANGVELTATAAATATTSLTGSYTFLDTRVTAAGFDTSTGASFRRGDPLMRRPRHTASASLGWRAAPGNQATGSGARALIASDELRLVVTRVGERTDRDFAAFPVAAVKLPAYVRADFALSLLIPRRPSMALTLRVENLLNARYEEVIRFGAPGRVFHVGMRRGR